MGNPDPDEIDEIILDDGFYRVWFHYYYCDESGVNDGYLIRDMYSELYGWCLKDILEDSNYGACGWNMHIDHQSGCCMVREVDRSVSIYEIEVV